MKGWRSRLEAHVVEWKGRHPVRWIPQFVYRFDDITSAAEILKSGVVYSRSRAEAKGCIVKEQSSRAILDITPSSHKDFARLYFRPCTPTQWTNEGIRPDHAIRRGAHCPVPVFLCFDFVETLAMDSTQFSTGNMASSRAEHGDSEELFSNLPFESIYHSTWMPQELKHELTFRRHAEVLIPWELPLNHNLRLIVCRSPAERRTLLHLLDAKTRRQWGDKIRIGYESLFQREWWFVTNVHAEGNRVVVDLHNGGAPIQLEYERQIPDGTIFTTKAVTLDSGKTQWSANAKQFTESVVTIRLAGHLAFRGTVVDSDVPF